MMRTSVPFSKRWVAKPVPQRMDRYLLAQPGRRACGTAGGVQYGYLKRPLLVAAGEQPVLRSGETPVAAQDRQQLWRQDPVTVLATLAVLNPDHHPRTVDVGNLEGSHFRDAQSGTIDRGQRGAALETWDCLQEADDLVGAQHDR